MSQFYGHQPLGWTPPADEDYQYVDILGTHSEHSRSFSSLSASSSHSDSDTDRHLSLTTSHSSGHPHHEPGWVARPRNPFIIFRCEYTKTHCRQGTSSNTSTSAPSATFKEPTLSKRAATVWHRMSPEEKEPYMIRAMEERADHARKYPGYRFRPRRRRSPKTRRNDLRLGTNVMFSYPGIAHDTCAAPTPFTSFGHTNSHPSTSAVGSSSDPNLGSSPSISGWTPPLACHVPDVEWGVTKPAVEESFVPRGLDNFDTNTLGMLSGWNDLLVSFPAVESAEPALNYVQTTPTSNAVNFPSGEYPVMQHQPYPDTDAVWSWYTPTEFSGSSSTQVPNVNSPYDVVTSLLQPVTISNYTTPANAVLGQSTAPVLRG